MKNFFKIFIPLLILSGLAYQFSGELKNIWKDIFPPAPCVEPIPYSLGAFDSRFGISKTYFLSALSDAEAVWEKPFNRELFVYAQKNDKAEDTLKINLIYDFRQEATSKLASLGITVQDTRASYDALKIKFTNLKAEFTAAKNHYTIPQ